VPLQKQFRGLPDFLGSFRGGTIPAEYGGVITPTFDVGPYLQEPEWIVGTLSCAAVADNTIIPVEPGERLLLHHFGWQTDSIVNVTNTRFAIGANVLLNTTTKVEIHRNPNEATNIEAAFVAGGMTNYPTPLFLQDIEHIRVYCKRYAGAGATGISFGLLVQKIKV